MWQAYAVRTCQLSCSMDPNSQEQQVNIEFEDNQDEGDNFEDIGLDIQLVKLCTGLKAHEDTDLA